MDWVDEGDKQRKDLVLRTGNLNLQGSVEICGRSAERELYETSKIR